MNESTNASERPVRHLFGIPIAALTLTEALDEVDRAIAGRRGLHIGVVNAAKVVNMHRDPSLREAVLSSNIIFADGMSVVWASRLLGGALPERVAGIDLMCGILERANTRHHRVFCLGATTEVLDATVAHFRRQYPGARIVGAHHGYYSKEQEPAIAQAIAESQADVLFVAMTSPKKEQFMARWSGRMNVVVSHGVGGSFDVVSGKVRRAPELWQRAGLEWLYRVKQEPGRLWRRYLVTNAMFCALVLSEWLGLRRGGTPARGPVHGQMDRE